MDTSTLQKIAEKAIEDAATIVGIIQILEVSNNGKINPALNAAGAGAAALQIQLSLIWRLQLITARTYLKPVKLGDLHLRTGFELLKNPSARRKHIAPSQSDAFSTIESRWLTACGDHRLPPILATRHKFIAHLGEPDKTAGIPTYKQLFEFSRETAEIMEGFAMAVGLKPSATVTEEENNFKKSSDAFWKPWNQVEDDTKTEFRHPNRPLT